MAKMQNASEEMMVQRARSTKNTNILISQHYPDNGERLLNDFMSNYTKYNKNYNVSMDRIWSIFGHEHDQKCFKTNSDTGNCDVILSGGGGGCCQTDGEYRGFYVIGFDEDKRMTQPLDIHDPKISCKMPCGVNIEEWEV